MAGEASVFLMDLAVVMGAAAVATVLFHRFRQPVVLGYLLAGLVVGPHTPPFAFVHDIATIEILGELGVVFLLFALGLEFNFRKLRKVGAAAIVSGAAQAAIMIWIGYVVGILAGFSPLEAVFLGAIICISSTVIIVKVVAAFGQQEEEWAQLVFGILIVEDIVAVIILTLISASGAAGGFTAVALVGVLWKLLLFLAAALVLGVWIVPWFVGYVARLGLPEILVVTVLGLAFGLAVLGGLLGFSAALGGFIMGALIAESDALHQVEELIHPIRDMFTAVFFVAIGMLVDLRVLIANWPIILIVAAVVVVGKIVAGFVATALAGYEHRTALRVGFGLAQIGEFSFVIAALALATYPGLTAPLFAIAVSVTAITSFTTPLLIRAAPRAVAAFDRRAPESLVTFLTLYAGWWRRLAVQASREGRLSRARAPGILAVLYWAATAAIVVAGGLAVEHIGTVVADSIGLGWEVRLLGWTVVGLAAAPFGVLAFSQLRRLTREIATSAIPLETGGDATASRDRRAIANALLSGFVAALTLGVALAVAPFSPPLPLLVAVVTTVAVGAVLLYGGLRRVQERVDAALSSLLEASPGAPMPTAAGARGPAPDLLVPADDLATAALREIPIGARVAVAGQTLREIDLRHRTGASALAVVHHGKRLLHPGPDTRLEPGASVLVLGDSTQLEAAERLLTTTTQVEQDQEDPLLSTEVRIAAEAPLAGRTLAEAGVREKTGATILGIRRGETRFTNPRPTTVLAVGDILHVVGTPEALARVEVLSRGSTEGAQPDTEQEVAGP